MGRIQFILISFWLNEYQSNLNRTNEWIFTVLIINWCIREKSETKPFWKVFLKVESINFRRLRSFNSSPRTVVYSRCYGYLKLLKERRVVKVIDLQRTRTVVRWKKWVDIPVFRTFGWQSNEKNRQTEQKGFSDNFRCWVTSVRIKEFWPVRSLSE